MRLTQKSKYAVRALVEIAVSGHEGPLGVAEIARLQRIPERFLEQILCEHICRAIAETADAERDPDLDAALLEMARGARDLFAQGLDIFEDRDIERARDLEAADDKIDLLYSEAMNLVVNPTNGGGAPEWRVRAALTVHYLERIADHGVDIGGSTVFLVTGQRIEDAMRQYLERDINRDDG